MTYTIMQILIEGETITEKVEDIENKIMLWNGESFITEYVKNIGTVKNAKAIIETIFTSSLKSANNSKYAFAIYEESPDGLENMIYYRFKADNLTIIYEDN